MTIDHLLTMSLLLSCGRSLFSNQIGDQSATAIADALKVNGALKKLVVPGGLEKHKELVAACLAKGVSLCEYGSEVGTLDVG